LEVSGAVVVLVDEEDGTCVVVLESFEEVLDSDSVDCVELEAVSLDLVLDEVEPQAVREIARTPVRRATPSLFIIPPTSKKET
jgi:hypothetical protein